MGIWDSPAGQDLKRDLDAGRDPLDRSRAMTKIRQAEKSSATGVPNFNPLNFMPNTGPVKSAGYVRGTGTYVNPEPERSSVYDSAYNPAYNPGTREYHARIEAEGQVSPRQVKNTPYVQAFIENVASSDEAKKAVKENRSFFRNLLSTGIPIVAGMAGGPALGVAAKVGSLAVNIGIDQYAKQQYAIGKALERGLSQSDIDVAMKKTYGTNALTTKDYIPSDGKGSVKDGADPEAMQRYAQNTAQWVQGFAAQPMKFVATGDSNAGIRNQIGEMALKDYQTEIGEVENFTQLSNKYGVTIPKDYQDILNAIRERGKSNLLKALEGAKEDQLGPMVSDLVNRGVIDSTIGQKAIGDFGEALLDTYGTKYNELEMFLGEKELGLYESELDRQLKYAGLGLEERKLLQDKELQEKQLDYNKWSTQLDADWRNKQLGYQDEWNRDEMRYRDKELETQKDYTDTANWMNLGATAVSTFGNIFADDLSDWAGDLFKGWTW